MKKSRNIPIAIGAFGEKAVEAELLRRGWISSNVNASVRNAPAFDIVAWRNRKTIHVRVKTCSPEQYAFQFSNQPGHRFLPRSLGQADFTILVRMGVVRQDDEFYIVPTSIVWKAINTHRATYLKHLRRDGGKRLDMGHWTLRLKELRSRENRPNYGFENKWAKYRGDWSLLDQQDAT